MAVVTEEFLTNPNWTASKLGNISEILKNPNLQLPIGETRKDSRYTYNYGMDSAWHQSRINELYIDYHKDPSQYRNRSIYECLKAYEDPFKWRPLMLILVSSDTESYLHLNDAALLQYEMIRHNYQSAYFLCNTPDILTKCASLASFNSQTIGTYAFKGNKIEYALYKDIDPIQTKMKKCYLHGSPQILIGMYVCIPNIYYPFILTEDLR